MDQVPASVKALLDLRPELSDLIGTCAQDENFQDLCSDTTFLVGSIDAVTSRRSKLELLRLLHKLYAEIDEYLINENRLTS